ncbi:MAG TPA: amidohydrolase family protein [Kineosporiaceae bacterium]
MSRTVLHLPGPVLVGPDEPAGPAWVIGGRLSFDPPSSVSPAEVQRVEGWALPGLVDAHAHIGLGASGAVEPSVAERQAITDRDSGVLLVRDAGTSADTRWMDDRDDLPRVVRAGRHLARTGRYLRGFAHELEPEELPERAVEQARLGDGWVKLVGDWIDRQVGDLAPCWPQDALKATIEAVHALGARVTAHCFGEDCLPDLLEAGIDCIEHACGLDDETRSAAARRGVAIVPTLVNIATFPRIALSAEQKFPVYASHMRRLHAQRYATVAAAYEEGVPVFVGTDAGSSLPHGLIAQEVAELVTAGIPPTAALDAASWGARSWLGRPALEEGASADLVVYPADPRQDVRVLASPRLVVLRGRPVG